MTESQPVNIADVKARLRSFGLNPAAGASPLADPAQEARALAIHARHPELTEQEARQMVILWEGVLLPFARTLNEHAGRIALAFAGAGVAFHRALTAYQSRPMEPEEETK